MGQPLHFLGFLVGVDKTILSVPLGKGFKIERMNKSDAMQLFADLEYIPYHQVTQKEFFLPWINQEEGSVYIIKRKIATKGLGYNRFTDLIRAFQKDYFDNYLDNRLRLMKLFKEGNIQLSNNYYYTIDQAGQIAVLQYQQFNRYLPAYPRFHIERYELPSLLRWLKVTNFPFKADYLQLAFDNYEESCHTQNISIAFMHVMMGFEAVFNNDPNDITYKLTRNAAVLLGEDFDECTKIFEDMKRFYVLRSKMVHGQKNGKTTINHSDLSQSREYLRQAIINCHKLGLDKERFFLYCTTNGFGAKNEKEIFAWLDKKKAQSKGKK